jgi:hypothetical protein
MQTGNRNHNSQAAQYIMRSRKNTL